jgi:hypothetical protein
MSIYVFLHLSALEKLGLNKKLLGLHSLRSDGVTAAATAHVEDRLFKKRGRLDKTKKGAIMIKSLDF